MSTSHIHKCTQGTCWLHTVFQLMCTARTVFKFWSCQNKTGQQDNAAMPFQGKHYSHLPHKIMRMLPRQHICVSLHARAM